MSTTKDQPKKPSGKNSLLIISGILAVIGFSLFAYLMFYVSPAEKMELVKIIAVTDNGCIGETMDGFSVNIGNCSTQPGEYVNALVDQKVKHRTSAMNP